MSSSFYRSRDRFCPIFGCFGPTHTNASTLATQTTLLNVETLHWREDIVHGGGGDEREPVPIGIIQT